MASLIKPKDHDQLEQNDLNDVLLTNVMIVVVGERFEGLMKDDFTDVVSLDSKGQLCLKVRVAKNHLKGVQALFHNAKRWMSC